MRRLVDVHRSAEGVIKQSLGKNLSNGLRLLDVAEEHPILDVSL